MHIINENVKYTNKKGEKIVYPLENALNSSNFKMNKRVKYTKQVLTHMMNVNKLKNENKEPEIKESDNDKK